MSEAKGGPAKAFADGLMITRAEARADLEAAVALALEGAADKCDPFAKASETRAAIRALIQPHQADALARVRQEAHNAAIEAAAEVVDPPDEDCGCDECHTRSKSAMHIRALALPVDGGAKG